MVWKEHSKRMDGIPFNFVNQGQLQQLSLEREWPFLPIRVPEAACSLNNRCFPPLPNYVRIFKMTFAGNFCASAHDTEYCLCRKKSGWSIHRLRVDMFNRNAFRN